MSLHQDLLEQAKFLARREPRRPRQASLRRAVSTAYYALFHLLISEASGLVVRDDLLKAALNRVFTHKEMARTAKAFGSGTVPKRFQIHIPATNVPQDLRATAKAFVELQQARHDADYDIATPFTRKDALTLVDLAEEAFSRWQRVRKEDCARLFLASFLDWDRLDKAP